MGVGKETAPSEWITGERDGLGMESIAVRIKRVERLYRGALGPFIDGRSGRYSQAENQWHEGGKLHCRFARVLNEWPFR